MKRVLVVIAMLFAFASVGAASAAFAQAGKTGEVQAVAAMCVVAVADQAPVYKPCTRTLNGIPVPCPHQPQLLPAAMPEVAAARDAVPGPPGLGTWSSGQGTDRQFRPPRA